jgi:hypothetical protein
MREWDKRSVQMLVWESVPRMQADVWLCFWFKIRTCGVLCMCARNPQYRPWVTHGTFQQPSYCTRIWGCESCHFLKNRRCCAWRIRFSEVVYVFSLASYFFIYMCLSVYCTYIYIMWRMPTMKTCGLSYYGYARVL